MSLKLQVCLLNPCILEDLKLKPLLLLSSRNEDHRKTVAVAGEVLGVQGEGCFVGAIPSETQEAEEWSFRPSW